jgi:cold-inducible RNA-binding protein
VQFALAGSAGPLPARRRMATQSWAATQYKKEKENMSNKLFVGGLSWNTDDQSLHNAFAPHGEVTEAKVIMERDSGRSRGFGFVTFSSADAAEQAVTAMDGRELDGRTLRVNVAQERSRDGGGGGRRNDRPGRW